MCDCLSVCERHSEKGSMYLGDECKPWNADGMQHVEDHIAPP